MFTLDSPSEARTCSVTVSKEAGVMFTLDSPSDFRYCSDTVSNCAGMILISMILLGSPSLTPSTEPPPIEPSDPPVEVISSTLLF